MRSETTRPAPAAPCIGVFDSGVGGLSVLRAVRRALPQAGLHYVADSAFAPYGERRDDEILDRAQRIAGYLIAQGARLVVVACNTATAVAIDSLRRTHPGIRFVGVEPGVRPALAASSCGRIAVMATGATLRSDRFRALVKRETAAGQSVHAQPCPGLAAAIERGSLVDSELQALIERFAQAVRAAKVDVVTLGCTHYAFVKADIERVLGSGISVIDTADAVAAQVSRSWPAADHPLTEPSCRLESSGDPQQLRDFAADWLGIDACVSPQALSL